MRWWRCHGICLGACNVAAPAAAGSIIVVVLIVFARLRTASAEANAPSWEEDKAYEYKTYTATMRYFKDLAQAYPDLVQTWIAQKEFPQIIPSKERWGNCGGGSCETLIVRIANKKMMSNLTPEVYFSGALHGDERVGPLVVTELAGFLCRHYGKVKEITHLVDTRAVWLTPMTNAEGYANNHRAEMGMDPNRDFPYLQHKSKCMTTQTARTVNELFRRHLFQWMITFHGGMRALTYEWGSKNHMVQRKSTEAPDNVAFREAGQALLHASGKASKNGRWFYPIGPINDMVYPVDGGMEDWSYAASWEASPVPITVCEPRTYGGYKKERTMYRRDSLATIVYLAEMDDYKTPPVRTLGRSKEMWSLDASQGHVARNMRMCLKLIEFAKPELIIQRPAWSHKVAQETQLDVRVHGLGCLKVSELSFVLVPRSHVSDCASLEPPVLSDGWTASARKAMLATGRRLSSLTDVPCRGLTIWTGQSQEDGIVKLSGRVPKGVVGEFCPVLTARFDQSWGKQVHPDPHVKPRTHAARIRVDEHYTTKASDGAMQINEWQVKLFPVLSEPLVVLSAAGQPADKFAENAVGKPRGGSSVGERDFTTTAIVPGAAEDYLEGEEVQGLREHQPEVEDVYVTPADDELPATGTVMSAASAIAIAVAALGLCNVVEAWKLAGRGLFQMRDTMPAPRGAEVHTSSP